MEAHGKAGGQGIAWVVMGVCGCGKSQTGSRLAARIGAPFFEGDDYHSPANVAKMRAGVPLDDDDRQGWLEALRDELGGRGESGAVLSCSSLKRAYRDILRAAGDVRFIHLAGERDLIAGRMGARPGHYMPTSLLDSQLETLEPLQPDEQGITLDIRETPERLIEQILDYRASSRVRR